MSENPENQQQQNTATEDVERLRGELEDARSKANTYLDLAQRSQADFANYKRRLEAERGGDALRARAGAIVELFPVLDDLERAVTHVPPELAENAWTRGVVLLSSQLQTALSKLGVERVGEIGEPFDPNRHEAVASEARVGVEPGHVVEVYRPGYRTAERLLRPAQVVVAAEGEPPAATPLPDEGDPGTRVDERA